jgi:hypothetical protein
MLVKSQRYKLKPTIAELTLTQIHALGLMNVIWAEMEKEATKN